MRKYAVVDIETTGGTPEFSRIIEIGVIITDGTTELASFHTLVNPECPIPRFITGLTGISKQMVQNQPLFSEIADQLDEITRDCIFVAHNVNFDYSFLRKEFAFLEKDFSRQRLCTIRLARQIFPGIVSYSLGNLCGSLKIQISDRHRAMGDAKATAELLNLIIKNDKKEFIDFSLKRNSSELLLPPLLKKESFKKLPKNTGIYYMHDTKGKVIYVGKAINIKQRIASHFVLNSSTRLKYNLINKIADISFLETGSEMMASVMEHMEIKRLWPEYNIAQKGPVPRYSIYPYQDGRELLRLGIVKKTKYSHAGLRSFFSLIDTHNYLREVSGKFKLCEKAVGISLAHCETEDCKFCFPQKRDVKKLNQKFNKVLEKLKTPEEPILCLTRGRNKAEFSAIIMDNDYPRYFGFIPKKQLSDDFLHISDFLTPLPGIINLKVSEHNFREKVERRFLKNYLSFSPSFYPKNSLFENIIPI